MRLLVPSQPVSPYRYIERLIGAATARRYGARHCLEIGPGADSVFSHLPPSTFSSTTVLDYNPRVLGEGTDRRVEAILLDVEQEGNLERLGRRWDLIVANAVLEHLADDRRFVQRLRGLLTDDGLALCTTVLGPGLYNLWDHAVGHYRRYTVSGLQELFSAYSARQIVQSSLLQELVRPLFFNRVRHLQNATLDENNWRFGDEHGSIGARPTRRSSRRCATCSPSMRASIGCCATCRAASPS